MGFMKVKLFISLHGKVTLVTPDRCIFIRIVRRGTHRLEHVGRS